MFARAVFSCCDLGLWLTRCVVCFAGGVGVGSFAGGGVGRVVGGVGVVLVVLV